MPTTRALSAIPIFHAKIVLVPHYYDDRLPKLEPVGQPVLLRERFEIPAHGPVGQERRQVLVEGVIAELHHLLW